MKKDLRPLRKEIAEMARDVIEAAGVPLAIATDLLQLGLQSFTFGMAFAVGQIHRLTPPDVHALAIAFLQDVYGLDVEEAAEVAEVIIDASSNEQDNEMLNAIIHRGIDGHAQWQDGMVDELRDNLRDILDALGEVDSSDDEDDEEDEDEAEDEKVEPDGRIRFRCPSCQKSLTVSIDHTGKKAKCPGCSETLQVPSGSK